MPRTEAVFLMPDLTGPDGNAYVLLGRARAALKDADVSEEDQKKFHDEATSSDYDNLLATVMDWFTVVRQVAQYEVLETIEGLVPGRSSSTDAD